MPDDDELPKEEERRPRIWSDNRKGECDTCGREEMWIVAGVGLLSWANHGLCRDCWFHFHDDFHLVDRTVIPPT